MESCDLARLIDHTNLRPDATAADVRTLCAEAREHGFATACVNPIWVATAAAELKGTDVGVCAVVGFPTGAHTTPIKVAEAIQCVRSGATEIDMVANHGWLKEGRDEDYKLDIAAVRAAIGSGVILKVIIEASLLTEAQIIRAAALVAAAGADLVKTSTGIYGQARLEDVILLRRILPPHVKIKAAGGIRTAEQARTLIDVGAERIGTSSSVEIAVGIQGR
jgi:deoxyribose-phosphate aldolase